MSKKFKVQVETVVEVILKPEAFTDEFCEEFRTSFYPFFELEEHAEHMGQLVAREVINEVSKNCGRNQFVEGYGLIGEFVASATIHSTDVETLNGDAS